MIPTPAPWPRPSVRALIAAVHGILTKTTDTSWPDSLDAYFVMRGISVDVERRYYFAPPIPPLEVFLWNHVRARALAEQMLLFPREIPLHIVAHSNGCDIALKTVRRLQAAQRAVDTVILTGSVVDPDVDKSGVLKLVESGAVSKVYAYVGDNDFPLAVASKIGWPYSDLGRVGFQRNGLPYADSRIITRRYAGYGHSDYFSAEHRDKTFAQISADCGITT